MGCLTQEMLENNLIDSNELMQVGVCLDAKQGPHLGLGVRVPRNCHLVVHVANAK